VTTKPFLHCLLQTATALAKLFVKHYKEREIKRKDTHKREELHKKSKA
jgi:hypothetical protein